MIIVPVLVPVPFSERAAIMGGGLDLHIANTTDVLGKEAPESITP